MKSIFTILTFCACITAYAQIPGTIQGNWVNQKSNEWEYGFFENFAIYNCEFWDYASIKEKGKKVNITLTNKSKSLNLEITKKNNSTLQIKNGNKSELFQFVDKAYPAYQTKDNSKFSQPLFYKDSVTIIGYYHNFNKIPIEQRIDNKFNVNVPDFVSNEQISYYTDIDSLGRFSLTFPVRGAQEYYTDWRTGRLLRLLVSEPGDILFIFADMNDLLYSNSDGDLWNDFMMKDKQILCMGNNARLNNELIQYKAPTFHFDRYGEAKNGIKGMAYLNKAKEVHEKRATHLNNYIANHPNLSDKFIFYSTEHQKYMLAFELMQHRFELDRGELFEQDFINFVRENFSLSDPSVYVLLRDFKSFLVDYIGYFDNQTNYSYNLTPAMIMEKLAEENTLDDELKEHLIELDKFSKQMETETDTLKIQEAMKNIEPSAAFINSNEVVMNLINKMFEEFSLNIEFIKSDSILANLPILKELWDASYFYKNFDRKRLPLNDRQMIELEKRINNPDIVKELLNVNSHYVEVAKKTLNENSLINTDHLADITDPEELLSKLTEPYKGKIIYLDFWGTWCGPCRENMKLVGDIEKELHNDDVIFMYLANNSPEESWKQIIKELDLTGEKIVHYRLPYNQQDLLETHLSVRSFPTYMILNKEGDIINNRAPSPMEKERLLRTIRELLSE